MNVPEKLSRILIIRNILILAFIVRAIVPLLSIMTTGDKMVFHSPDSTSYIQPASKLMAEGKFSNLNSPEIQRTPGYPLFLIPGMWIGQLEAVTIFLQILLSCFTVYLIWQVARLLFANELVPSICALLYTVEPLSIVYTSKILSETCFTAVIMVFVYTFLKYFQQQKLSYLIISSLALAGSVYIRPISYYLPVIFALIILGWGWKLRNNRTIIVKHTGIFFMISVILISAWQIRNKHLTGYSGFSSIVDINLYFYFGSAIIADKEGRPFNSVLNERRKLFEENNLPGYHKIRDKSLSSQLRFMRQRAFLLMYENPIVFLKTYFAGLARNVSEPCTVVYLQLFHLYKPRDISQANSIEGMTRYLDMLWGGVFMKKLLLFMKERPLIFWGNLIMYGWGVFYWIFALIGAFDKKVSGFSIMVIIVLSAYFILISAGPNSENRFRFVSMPGICLLAGWGIYSTMEKIKSRMGEKAFTNLNS